MTQQTDEIILRMRDFNRYYTNVLGLLNQHILGSGYSLSEARVLHEIGRTQPCTAAALAGALHIDAGYLSRMLKRFESAALLSRERSEADGRSYSLRLTREGEAALDALNKGSEEQLAGLIKPMTERRCMELLRGMQSIQAALGREIDPGEVAIRTELRPGDAGHITAMHGRIYSEEYGYSSSFEAYVAQSFFDFLLNYSPGRERLWCAEHFGQIVGCIGVVDRGERAQLRWFLLEAPYRGLGLGRRLLESALSFAREKGYKSVYLDTTDDLEDAVRMYSRAGFTPVASKPNDSWRAGVNELEMELSLV